VEILAKLVEKLAITLAPLLGAIFLLCGFSLTLPERYPLFAPAKEVVNQYRPWIVFGLMASAAYLIILGLVWIGKTSQRWYFKIRLNRLRIERLRDLTDAEKHVLQVYLRNGSRTEVWGLQDGVVNSMIQNGILIRGQLGNVLDGFPCDISYAVWKHIQAHPELIATGRNPRVEGLERRW
jgi:hypothetical protein